MSAVLIVFYIRFLLRDLKKLTLELSIITWCKYAPTLIRFWPCLMTSLDAWFRSSCRRLKLSSLKWCKSGYEIIVVLAGVSVTTRPARIYLVCSGVGVTTRPARACLVASRRVILSLTGVSVTTCPARARQSDLGQTHYGKCILLKMKFYLKFVDGRSN